MDEKSNHLMNVSAEQGDKQRRVKGDKFRRYEGGNRRGELEERTGFFFFYRTVPSSQRANNNHHSLSLSLCVVALQYF